MAYQESKARLNEDQQNKFHSKLKKQGLKTFATYGSDKPLHSVFTFMSFNLMPAYYVIVCTSKQVLSSS